MKSRVKIEDQSEVNYAAMKFLKSKEKISGKPVRTPYTTGLPKRAKRENAHNSRKSVQKKDRNEPSNVITVRALTKDGEHVVKYGFDKTLKEM